MRLSVGIVRRKTCIERIVKAISALAAAALVVAVPLLGARAAPSLSPWAEPPALDPTFVEAARGYIPPSRGCPATCLARRLERQHRGAGAAVWCRPHPLVYPRSSSGPYFSCISFLSERTRTACAFWGVRVLEGDRIETSAPRPFDCPARYRPQGKIEG